MGPDRLAVPPGNLSLLGTAVISGMLTITLMLTRVTSKVSPYTSTDISVRSPFPPAKCSTLHRQRNPKQKQDLHLRTGKKKKIWNSPQLSAPRDIPDFKVLHPALQGQAEMLLTSFFQSMDRLQTCAQDTSTYTFFSRTLKPRTDSINGWKPRAKLTKPEKAPESRPMHLDSGSCHYLI